MLVFIALFEPCFYVNLHCLYSYACPLISLAWQRPQPQAHSIECFRICLSWTEIRDRTSAIQKRQKDDTPEQTESE